MNARNRKALERIIQLSEKYGFDIWIYNAPLSEFREEYSNALSYVYSLQEENASIKYIDSYAYDTAINNHELSLASITATDDVPNTNPTRMVVVEKIDRISKFIVLDV